MQTIDNKEQERSAYAHKHLDLHGSPKTRAMFMGCCSLMMTIMTKLLV